jgi:hypothetical protein
MSVIRGHHVIHMTPIDAHIQTPHKTNMLHLRKPLTPLLFSTTPRIYRMPIDPTRIPPQPLSTI